MSTSQKGRGGRGGAGGRGNTRGRARGKGTQQTSPHHEREQNARIPHQPITDLPNRKTTHQPKSNESYQTTTKESKRSRGSSNSDQGKRGNVERQNDLTDDQKGDAVPRPLPQRPQNASVVPSPVSDERRGADSSKDARNAPVSKNIKKNVYFLMKKEKHNELEQMKTKYFLDIYDIPLEGDTEQIQVLFSTSSSSVEIREAVKCFYDLYQQTRRELYNLPQGYKLNNSLKVYIHTSNIVHLNVSGIVNAANGGLFHGGGVAKAIADAAGADLNKESQKLVRINKKDFETSDVIATTAGNLPCDVVLHAVGPRWPGTYASSSKMKREDAEKECIELLRATFTNVLWYSNMLQLQCIAMPPISSGIYGVPHKHVAQEMTRAILTFSKCEQDKSLDEIHLVDIGEDILAAVSANLKTTSEGGENLPLEDVLEGMTARLDKSGKRDHIFCNMKEGNWKSYLSEMELICAETDSPDQPGSNSSGATASDMKNKIPKSRGHHTPTQQQDMEPRANREIIKKRSGNHVTKGTAGTCQSMGSLSITVTKKSWMKCSSRKVELKSGTEVGGVAAAEKNDDGKNETEPHEEGKNVKRPKHPEEQDLTRNCSAQEGKLSKENYQSSTSTEKSDQREVNKST